MTKNIWQLCEGANHISDLQTTAWRLVESQDLIATRKLVDSLEEQRLLEDMIESIKPSLTPSHSNLHALLYTPFRYPPLLHGSRFASRFEQSLWYGSSKLTTSMSEKAFYQFNFLRGTTAKFDLVQIPMTAFSTQIKTARGIHLLREPFAPHKKIISSPMSYDESQKLGNAMRECGVEAFNYFSARTPEAHENIGVFTPAAFPFKKPDAKSFHSWQCNAGLKYIEFVRTNSLMQTAHSFELENFLVDGALPFPAA